MFKAEELLNRMKNGEILLGSHVSLNTPYVSEMLGLCGFDFIWIDAEHSALSTTDIQEHLLACKAVGTAGIVRVRENNAALMKPVMDMGADGVIIPMVSSVEEAQKAAAATHYPPHGIRGMGQRRVAGYGLTEKAAYCQNTEKGLLTFVQIEDVRAMDEIEEMVLIPGISGFIIGPNDFSMSMRTEERVYTPQDPEVKARLEKVSETIRKAGKPLGVSGTYSEEFVRYWVRQGASFISMNFDFHYIVNGGKQVFTQSKEILENLKQEKGERYASY